MTAAPVALSLHRPDEWPSALSTPQVAELFQLGERTVRRMIDAPEVDGMMVSGHYRITAESVARLVPRSIRAHWPDDGWWTTTAAPPRPS